MDLIGQLLHHVVPVVLGVLEGLPRCDTDSDSTGDTDTVTAQVTQDNTVTAQVSQHNTVTAQVS